VSRRQEFAADLLAARTVGARPLLSALDKTERAAVAFDAYWRSEVLPTLESGFLPPITGGFVAFMSRPSITEQVDRAVREKRASPPDGSGDSHPSFQERAEALRSLAPGPDTGADAAAISLLTDVPALETALGASLMKPDAPRLEPIVWNDVGARVVVPGWRRLVAGADPVVAGLSVASLPELTADAEKLGRLLARLRGADAWLSQKSAARIGLSTLEGVLGLTLRHDGWQVDSQPGLPIVLGRNGSELDPRDTVEKLSSGQLTPASWRQQCAELGIGNVRLTLT
jgi:hypothetical protein